ncbi:hypothetical protein HXXDennis_43 [Xanthomonas phage HXX_Dennis]|nr:hypothetical protein [Stenotrophomonas phage StM171]UTQ79934.1 hypothetical protein HXXDennis_43 [Xanthomonas phage HXX_Dennis]
MATTFTRGQLVRWHTQGNGSRVNHVGVVVLQVPAGVPLGPLMDSLQKRYNTRAIVGRGPRSETSYLVARTGGRGLAKLHWPHAAAIRPYEDPCNATDETPPLVG